MSKSNNEPPSPISRALPLVQLRREGDAVIVVPDSPELQRFHLPRIDKSLVDWLSSALEQILREHQRCAAILLALDLSTPQWTFYVPRQNADRDAACWLLHKNPTVVLPPTNRIAGSLQVRILAPGEEAADAIPPVDGLHIVQVFNEDILTMWCFLRVHHEAMHVDPDDVIERDLARLVAKIRDRTQFI